MRKGQSTLEYLVILAIFVAALLTMKTYFKRSLQGYIKENVADSLGELYAPRDTNSDITLGVFGTETSDSVTVEETVGGVEKLKTTVVYKEEMVNLQSGWEEMGPMD